MSSLPSNGALATADVSTPASASSSLATEGGIAIHTALGRMTLTTSSEPLSESNVSSRTNAPTLRVMQEPLYISRSFAAGDLSENRLLQLWEGRVLSATSDELVAVLRDLSDSQCPDEEIALSLDELAPEDRELVEPGSVFYWSVRYEQGPGWPRRRVSRIRFRRLPGVTRREIDRAEQFAQEAKSFWSE